MDERSQQIAMLARSKLMPKVGVNDIQKIIRKYREFAIVELATEG